jgi:hypothetical protein
MTRTWSRVAVHHPGHPSQGRLAGDERGQALAIVAAVVALLALLPVSVQLLATGQLPVKQQAVERQQAVEAARAGVSDYVNHLESPLGYLQYCSNQVPAAQWTCDNGSGPDTSNPAFAVDTGDNTWASVQGTVSDNHEAFHYVVDSAGLNPGQQGTVVVYVTGRAGANGRYVYATIKAELQATPSSPPYWFPPSPGATCAPDDIVTAPLFATYAKVTLWGAEGGGQGSSGNGQGGGSYGAELVAYPPVVGGQTWLIAPGEAGVQGQSTLLSLLGIGAGGPTCLGSMNLGGGQGGYENLLGVITGTGGGGGAGSGICVEGSGGSQCNPTPAECDTSYSNTPCVLAVAGGGGGQGGLGGGLGGYDSATSTSGNGDNGTTICLLICLTAATGGSLGGNTSAPVTQGGAGKQQVLALVTGQGGGGGGGFPNGGGGGGAGGVLSLLAGTGGGGGGGDSTSSTPTASGCPTPTLYRPVTYPASDTNGNGAVQVEFFSGTPCSGTALLSYSVVSLAVEQVPANSA